MNNEKTMFLIRGCSGSGKTTIADMIQYYIMERPGCELEVCPIFSTDNLWYDQDGFFKFDFMRLGEMHKKNQEYVQAAMTISTPNIIVDNTNTTQREVQPYLDMAKEYGYVVRTIEVGCSVEVAKDYNSKRSEDRRVPEEGLIVR